MGCHSCRDNDQFVVFGRFDEFGFSDFEVLVIFEENGDIRTRSPDEDWSIVVVGCEFDCFFS